MRHEPEHLHVRGVYLLELANPPRLVHSLGDTFRHSQMHPDFAGTVDVLFARAAEQQTDAATINHQRTGHTGLNAFFQQNFCRARLRIAATVFFKVTYDTKQTTFNQRAQSAVLQVFRKTGTHKNRFIFSAHPP